MLHSMQLGRVLTALLSVWLVHTVLVPAVARPAEPSLLNLDGQQLLQIGDLHEVQNHLQEALPYYQQAVQAFRVRRNRAGEALALSKVGRVLQRQDKHAEALSALQNAVALLSSPDQRQLRAATILTLGEVLERLGRLEDARQAYVEARRLYRDRHDPDGSMRSALRLAVLLSLQGETMKATALLREAVEEAGKHRAHASEIEARTLLGDLLAGTRQDEARSQYTEALRLAEATGDRAAEATVRSRLATSLAEAGETAQALQMARRALGLYQSVRDRAHEAETLSLLGSLRRRAGDLDGAVEYHERALGLYRALRDRAGEAAALKALAPLYADRGQEQTALDTERKADLLLQRAP